MFLILAIILLMCGQPYWALASLIVSLGLGIYANKKRN